MTAGLRTMLAGVLGGALLAAPLAAEDAASFPSRPLTMVVPSAPGGNTDTYGRLIGDAISTSLRQPVVVKNIPGAGSAAGNAFVASADPDGYVMVIDPPAPITIVPLLRPDLHYEASDLAPISQILTNSHILVVNPDKVPARSLEGLVALLRKDAGKYRYATAGIGSTYHLGTALFMTATGTELTHVPFKSSGEATTALLGGHVDLVIGAAIAMLPLIKAGKVLPIAVMTPERTPELPDIPSVKEAFPSYPGYASWLGIFTRAGTPPEIVEKLSAEIAAYVTSSEGAARIREFGGEPVGSSPAEFQAVLDQEIKVWKAVIEGSNINMN